MGMLRFPEGAAGAAGAAGAPESVCVVTLDRQQRIVTLSADCRRLFGAHAEAARGQPLAALLHPAVPPAVADDITETLEAGEIWAAPLAWRGADDAAVWLFTTVTTLGHPAGGALFIAVGTVARPAPARTVETLYRAMRRWHLTWRDVVECAHDCDATATFRRFR